RGTYIADRAIDWLTEADATLRTTFHAIILSTISAVAIVVFVICLAIMVIVSLSGIKRKQVGNAG
ncbi:MAG: hypothetical protein FWB79_04455, partial [Treponema sp.]|nr:hypothetical protein [Treponema sp.]